jgi:hypothetical protein
VTIRRFARSTLLFAEVHLVTAVAFGFALRLAMRLVALSIGQPVQLTSATLFIFIVAIVLGAPLSLAFFLLRRKVRGTPLRRGLWYGLAMVVVGGRAVFPEAVTVGHAWLNVPLFTSILVLYGVVFSVTVDRLERRAARRRAIRVSRSVDRLEAPVPPGTPRTAPTAR